MTLVVDLCQHSLGRPEFVSPIVATAGPDAAVKHYTDVTRDDVSSASSVILCGTALRDYDYLDHMDRFGWLEDPTTPVLGICAGMQVIGLVHGCKVVRGKEIGMTRVEPLVENFLLDEPTEVYNLHGHTLDSLDEFDVWARSEFCVQIVAHESLEQYGVMFHPEVRRRGVVNRFLDRFTPGR